MTQLIVEDLLLLLTDDKSGERVTPYGDGALDAALLVDLAQAGRIEITEIDGKAERLRILSAEATGDPMLDAALDRLVGVEGKGVVAAIRAVRPVVEEQLADRLVEAGLLERREEKVWGLFTKTRLPAGEGTRERQVREELAAVLAGRSPADERTGTLISLMQALQALETAVDPAQLGMTSKELEQAALAIAGGRWGADTVSATISSMNTVLFTIMTTTIITSSTVLSD